MIEVFKTNVINDEHAKMLIDQIHFEFSHYKVNFDLEDCDKILRVESVTGYVDSSILINLLDSFGFYAEILPDDDPTERNYTIDLVTQSSIEF
ncbi:MAG: hypothetical protein WBP41_19180 [Saprospiraceae bacterium]